VLQDGELFTHLFQKWINFHSVYFSKTRTTPWILLNSQILVPKLSALTPSTLTRLNIQTMYTLTRLYIQTIYTLTRLYSILIAIIPEWVGVHVQRISIYIIIIINGVVSLIFLSPHLHPYHFLVTIYCCLCISVIS
jgi:hypothetical protein